MTNILRARHRQEAAWYLPFHEFDPLPCHVPFEECDGCEAYDVDSCELDAGHHDDDPVSFHELELELFERRRV